MCKSKDEPGTRPCRSHRVQTLAGENISQTLAFLFLNNNLHAVHHLHPQVAWYNLPRLYRDNADSYDGFNEDYNYRSYAQVIARYFVKAKDPVQHPLWPSE